MFMKQRLTAVQFCSRSQTMSKRSCEEQLPGDCCISSWLEQSSALLLGTRAWPHCMLNHNDELSVCIMYAVSIASLEHCDRLLVCPPGEGCMTMQKHWRTMSKCYNINQQMLKPGRGFRISRIKAMTAALQALHKPHRTNHPEQK